MKLSNSKNRLVTLFFSEKRDAWCVTFSYFDGEGAWLECKFKELWPEEAKQLAPHVGLKKERPTSIRLDRFEALLQKIEPDHRLYGAIDALDLHEAGTREFWENAVVTKRGEQ
jgi:hypothetical protein